MSGPVPEQGLKVWGFRGSFKGDLYGLYKGFIKVWSLGFYKALGLDVRL